MGQKSNTLTLRNSKSNLSLQTSNPKSFLYGFTFLNLFEKLLLKKGVLIIEKTLNFENNKCLLNLTGFFRTNKLLNFRRKGLFLKKRLLKTNSIETKNNSLSNLIENQFKLLKTNFVEISFKNINKTLNKKLLIIFYKKLNRFSGVLFARRFNLFIDFLKLSSLFVQSKIPSSTFLIVLGQIFKILPKRKHNRFLFFLKFLFQIILKDISSSSILGMKFIVNGKLQGKTRASSSCIQIGSVPIQSIGKDISFTKAHVYTRYGAFGFQFWVHKK